jgi:hypothetical protein
MSEEDQKLNFRRISDQAALIQNIAKIKPEPKYTDPKPGKSVFVSSLEFGDYSKLQEDGISINKLYNFKTFIEAYNKLNAASLSALTPYINIYKIYEDGSERFIPFNNYYPRAAINAMTNSKSDRGYQANIQSVKISSQGKDTATTFIYTVDIKFIFDSVQTLFNDNSKYIELFNPPKKLKYKRGDGDPKYYQIKLEFGWNVSPDITRYENLKPNELKKFADASRNEVFLNYTKHIITITEEGSVMLTVEYIGSLEIEARNPAKFSILSSEKIEELKKVTNQIDSIVLSLDNRGLKHEQILDSDKIQIKILDNEGKEIKTNDKQLLEELYNKKKSLESNSADEFQQGIIKNILKQFGSNVDGNGNIVPDHNVGTLFPVLLIEETSHLLRKELVEETGLGQLAVSSKNQQIINLENNPENVKLYTGLTTAGAEQLDLKNFINKLEFAETTTPGNLIGGKIINLNANKKYYRIPFFTFRNLLKSLVTLYGVDAESDFLILGTHCYIQSFKTGELIDPKAFSNNPEYKIIVDNGLGLGKENNAIIENKVTEIDIFNIPIALSTFRYWFNKNISSQNLTQMSLMTFLNLCINELFVLAVNPVNSDYVPKQNITFKYSMDRISFNRNNKLLQNIKNNQGFTESVLCDKKDLLLESEQKISESIKKNVIVFYTVPKHNTRVSNIKTDLEDGIPHFFYGQNKGIVNKITFREENIPFFKEANIQTQVDRKPWRPGVFLRSKYNVMIEMFGTVQFRPGTMIYISPSFPGVINVGEPLDFGIGGYFMIISINSEIESGKYITTIEANWVSTGTGEYTDLSHFPIKVVSLPRPLVEIQAEQEASKQQENNSSFLSTILSSIGEGDTDR